MSKEVQDRIRSIGEELSLHFVEQRIPHFTREIAEMLVGKNQKYGDSALSPMGVFSKDRSPETAFEGLKFRIDDKLARIQNSENLRKNDVIDLIGYLVLLCLNRGWEDLRDQQD